jgi:hypothetical protein
LRKFAPRGILKPIALSLVVGLTSSDVARSEDITKFNTIETRAAATVNAIKISNQKLTFRDFKLQKYGGLEWPILSFNVANKSRVPVKRLFLRASLRRPGRAIPIAEKSIDYRIAGGIAPGESRHVELDAALVGDWSDVTKAAVRNASFQLTLTAVEDEGGNRLVR